jgi:hypothetical protein
MSARCTSVRVLDLNIPSLPLEIFAEEFGAATV